MVEKKKKPAVRGKKKAAPPAKPKSARAKPSRTEPRAAAAPERLSSERLPAEKPRRQVEAFAPRVPATGIQDLSPARGATRSRKRVGRGPGSGHGKTAGRGSKGQKSRSGYQHQRGFEGGQMPLHRRVPKRGFTNIFRIAYDIVNLADLARFEAGEAVNPETLRQRRLAGKRPVKILGKGELGKPLTVCAHKFSASAKARIEAAGGRCEVIPR